MSIFRQRDVTRAIKAARLAGMDVASCEIDPATGKIEIFFADRPGEISASDVNGSPNYRRGKPWRIVEER
jgi:uncharacterized protein YigE (DUF2233 family)